jgi:FAD/FMN-containing dehydrogenase
MPSVRTTVASKTTVNAAAIEALKGRLRGDVLTPESPGYDQAREVWNAFINKHPAVIVRCAGAADVIQAVGFARESGLIASVRGGGHNIAGSAVCDGLVIDLSKMNSVRVNPDARRADVGPGATLADVDREAQAFGLVTPTGINSTTGIAGLTLGGGFGWLSRRFGLTLDNLVSADVVTAEGKLVHASAKENLDLFWGIRGGGGNFGIVTNFEFKLYPLGPEVYAGLLVFGAEEAQSVLDWYREFVNSAPDELTVWAVMRQAPPLPFLPEKVHGKNVVVLALCYSGDPAKGEKAIQPIRGFGKILGEMVGRMPFVAWQQAFDPLLARGARNYWKTHNFTDLTDDVVSALVDHAGRLPSPHCEVFIGHLTGQVERVAEDATAYPHRRVKFVMNVHSRWEKATDDDACIAWARSLFNATTPHATGGAYINFMTDEEGERVPTAYGGETWKRLVTLKNKWDPSNFFSTNQNIKPSA